MAAIHNPATIADAYLRLTIRVVECDGVPASGRRGGWVFMSWDGDEQSHVSLTVFRAAIAQYVPWCGRPADRKYAVFV